MASYNLNPYFREEHHIRDPILPFTGLIPDRVRPGMVIDIHGRVNMMAHEIKINLAVGTDMNAVSNEYGDLALHLSPRWHGEHCLVRNSKINGQWGPEERAPHGRNPFSRMCDFRIEILVEERMYRIAVDGRHFAEFGHRIPFEYVGILGISGDCHIYSIRFGDVYHGRQRPAATVPYSTAPVQYVPGQVVAPAPIIYQNPVQQIPMTRVVPVPEIIPVPMPYPQYGYPPDYHRHHHHGHHGHHRRW